MPEIFVSADKDLAEGDRRIIRYESQEIGVFRVQGEIRAFLNQCPHQGGPVCEGLLVHKPEEIIREDKTYAGMRFCDKALHLVCPWHGWEFDVASGAIAGDGKVKLRTFRTVNREGNLYVLI